MNKTLSSAPAFVARLERVAQQINAGELKAAALALNDLSRGNTHDPRLFLLGAELASASGNPDGTLAAARKAHDLLPGWIPSSMYLARVLARRGVAEESLSLVDSALAQALADSEEGRFTAEHTELLVKAAEVAQIFDLHDKAWGWLRQALKFQPDNPVILNQMARTLNFMGDPMGALDTLNTLMEQLPDRPGLRFNRLVARLHAGQFEAAAQDADLLVALQPDNEVYAFYHQLAHKQTPATQPARLLVDTFNSFAARYDEVMVKNGRYRLPIEVVGTIHDWFADRPFDVLDLGCGTGLLGAGLQQLGGALVGADLSVEMLKLAEAHQCYHSLRQVNLLDAVRETPSEHYDLIAALDVFPYVGDLSSVIPNVFRILTAGGRFIFSCETSADCTQDYCLPLTFRYLHQQSYVQGLLQEAGFTDLQFTDKTLRVEEGTPIKGFFASAQKPA